MKLFVTNLGSHKTFGTNYVKEYKQGYYIYNVMLRLSTRHYTLTLNDDTTSFVSPSTYGPKILCSRTRKVAWFLVRNLRRRKFQDVLYMYINRCHDVL